MICLSLTASVLEENAAALRHYREWIRLAEIRVDRLEPDQLPLLPAFLDRMHAELDIGFILTIRTIEDGGVWAFGEDERRGAMLRILESVKPGTLLYVDIETKLSWPEVEAAATRLGARIIRSSHNFAGTPGDLESSLPRQYRLAGDVVKAAVMVRGMADLAVLLGVARRLRQNGRPFILIGMGPYGLATRILATRLGSLLTFASSSLQGHVAAAPGHMDPKLLAETFGYYQVDDQTRIFGILGNPVLHSRSPGYHNQVFRERGLNAVYLPFQVDDLAAFFQLADELPLAACSVTIPHKEAVRGFLADSELGVRQIGACNTMIKRAEGWFGMNTDAPGFFKPLAGCLEGIKNRRAVVIGAGGAARAIVQALLSNGFQLLILNRSLERAQGLAREFELWYPASIQVAGLPEAPAAGPAASGQAAHEDIAALSETVRSMAELVVQTTSVGMEGHGEQLDPFWFHHWEGSEIAYDIIYTPERTAFLARAQASGCRTINGWPMFEEQARLQSAQFVAACSAKNA